MVKYIPSQKNRINLSIRFSFNIPDHQGASDELHTLNKCLRGRCYFPSPHGIKILWLEAPDKPDSVLWKAGRETVSNCSLMNEVITKLSLTAGIPMGRKGPLCWWTSFPSLTSTKINNLILGKSGLPGRHNVFGVFTAAGDPGAKGQGMLLIQVDWYEESQSEVTKIMCDFCSPALCGVCLLASNALIWFLDQTGLT